MTLLLLTTAPVFIILLYIYYRDKYEKEPLSLLFKGLIAGMLIVLPVITIETFTGLILNPDGMTIMPSAFTSAFLIAALTEEGFKFIAVYILIWKNKEFNEEFDGIVYAVFVSLGFALVENFSYVYLNDNGYSVGLSRAFTAIPAHAVFGILMGYHLGLAKFDVRKRGIHLINAFVYPFVFHGIYDFILMSEHPLLLSLFLPILGYMYFRANKRMRALSKISPFNPVNKIDE
jgi:RsiW-degrading membrane proteinase PrsW (M82 family)